MALHIQDLSLCRRLIAQSSDQKGTAAFASRNLLVTNSTKSGLQLNIAQYARRQSAIKSTISVPDQLEYWRGPVFVAETITGELT